MSRNGALRHALPKPLAGVVFDCDGVLIDSRASNAAYYNRIRELAGLAPMNREEEEFSHMYSSEESLRHILPARLHGRLRELQLLVDYRRDILPLIRPQPGLHACLERLRSLGLRAAVLTNRGRGGMTAVLDAFDLHPYFDPVMTVTNAAPKPSPDGLLRIAAAWAGTPGELVFVGDSLLDALAAEAAGVCFVAYRNPALNARGHAEQLEDLARACAEIVLENARIRHYL
jgi:HAD superfamily hydrolase (TIGR01509 family)